MNTAIFAFAGVLIPLLDIDFDSKCLMGNVTTSTIDGLYKGYYSLMVCFICFFVPLAFFVFYKYVEDDMKYCCFALFWMILPAFLVVIFLGHVVLILTLRDTPDNSIFLVLIGCYIVLGLSVIITITVTIMETLEFGTRQAYSESRELRIVPVGANGVPVSAGTPS